ncbi:protein YdgV [Leclercia adecarboxylata]|uniref:protein YdgV n=1 Tax=Leclercia TaxID=83654 RepID=UPI003AF11261
MFNYWRQFSSALTRSNTADNCNFMDNLFSTALSKITPALFSSFCLTSGEQHWRNAL